MYSFIIFSLWIIFAVNVISCFLSFGGNEGNSGYLTAGYCIDLSFVSSHLIFLISFPVCFIYINISKLIRYLLELTTNKEHSIYMIDNLKEYSKKTNDEI
jgi:hypothetical protein